MTRRDFILIAETLAAAKPLLPPDKRPVVNDLRKHPREAGAYEAWRNVCARMASALCNTNPRFDRDRFLKACGVES